MRVSTMRSFTAFGLVLGLVLLVLTIVQTRTPTRLPLRAALSTRRLNANPLRLTNRVPRTCVRVAEAKKPWQLTADTLMNIDATQEERLEAIRNLFERRDELGETFRSAVSTAIENRDINSAKDILYPEGTEARRQIDALETVRRQLISDIIPEISNPEKLRSLFPSADNTVTPPRINATEAIKQIRSEVQSLSKDPSELQSRISSYVEESKNIFRRTPVGLEMPNYTVLAKGEGYEIREYEPYTIVSTPMRKQVVASDDPAKSIVENAGAFSTLAGYLFGENQEKKAMQMTAPVEVTIDSEGSKDMAFVLPSDVSESAPAPELDDDISIQRLPSQIVAVKEFPGFVTEQEIKRQKAELLDILEDCPGYAVADKNSFRVLQWNPPYTLPWIRRNEICTKVLPVAEVAPATFEEETLEEAPEEVPEVIEDPIIEVDETSELE